MRGHRLPITVRLATTDRKISAIAFFEGLGQANHVLIEG